MFKKRSKPKATRKTPVENDDDNEEETNTADAIQQTKKKRKLLTDLQYRRGTAADQLLQAPAKETVVEEPSDVKPADDGSKTQPAASTILEQRHQQAMEDFIRKKLGQDTPEVKEIKKQPLSTEEERMYAELAAKATAHATVRPQDDATTTLTAGTAVALEEVVLPIEERLRSAQETQRQSKKYRLATTTMPSVPSAVPNRFEMGATPAMPEAMLPDAVTKKAPEPVAAPASSVDIDRAGFVAWRGKATPASKLPPTQRASDDRVYKKFVERQREQRESHKK